MTMQFKGQQIGLLLLVLAALGLVGFGLYWQFGGQASAIVIDYKDADTVALGQTIYAQHCASCHGANLEGQPDWRMRRADGRLPAPPHNESGHTWHHDDRQLFELTKLGPAAVVGGTYQSDMKPLEGVLSDEEMLASLAFIKSTWPEEIRERHNQINRRADY